MNRIRYLGEPDPGKLVPALGRMWCPICQMNGLQGETECDYCGRPLEPRTKPMPKPKDMTEK